MKFKDKFLEVLRDPNEELETVFVVIWLMAALLTICIVLVGLVFNFGPIAFVFIVATIFVSFPVYVYFKADES